VNTAYSRCSDNVSSPAFVVAVLEPRTHSGGAGEVLATVGCVTTTPDTQGSDDVENDREGADLLAHFVDLEVDKLDNYATADEMAAWPRAEKIASAQLTALQAIHRELRHGNDQTALQVEALTKHTKALADHTDAMESLRHALDGHGDAVSRMPRG
jgi:hypothetical protein